MEQRASRLYTTVDSDRNLAQEADQGPPAELLAKSEDDPQLCIGASGRHLAEGHESS